MRAMPDLQHRGGAAVVHVRRCQVLQATVMMRVVVPREQRVADRARILDRAEAVRELRAVLEGPELGFRARRVRVTATITAEKGPRGIRIQSSHLSGEVERLEGIDQARLQKIAQETRERCTISIALEGSVAITHDVIAR